MKKQKLFLSMMTIIIIISSSTKLLATRHHYYLNNTSSTETFNVCNITGNDSAILHIPSIALTNKVWFNELGNPMVGDSMIITSIHAGNWSFSSNEIEKNLYIYFSTSVPYKPECMSHDTLFCNPGFNYELNAQNPGCSYLWDNGSTSQTRSITTADTCWLEITNGCGIRRDSIKAIYYNPNLPHLGNDTTFCYGNNILLNPHNTNILSYYWSTGENTPTLSVDTTGEYWIYTQDVNGCLGRDTIHITVNETPTQGIKLATINTDETSPNYGNNKITWDIEPTFNTTATIIYRESGTDNYIPIDTVGYTTSEWSDNVNSNNHSWKYKIALIGPQCGEGNLSESVQTIHCWVSEFNGTYTIQWDPYSIGAKSNSVNWYKVLSGNQLNGLTIRDSVSGNLTSLSLPNTTDSIFLIGAELIGGKGFTGLALSNKTHNPTTITNIHSPIEIPFSIYPNPAKELINININLKSFQVEISNMFGQVLLTEQNTKVLNVDNLAQGIYIISIKANNIKTNKMFIKN